MGKENGIDYFPCPEGCWFMRKIGLYARRKIIFWQCNKCLSSAHTCSKTGEIIDIVTYDHRFDLMRL